MLRAVVVDAEEGPEADAEAEAAALRALASNFPTQVVDAVMDGIPAGAPTLVHAGPLFARTHPRGADQLVRLPLVAAYGDSHIQLATEWDGINWVFPLTWKDLAIAPLIAGWEIRQQTTMTPDVEDSTPYLVFRSETMGVMIAIHPNAVRALALSLSRLVASR